MAGSRQLIQRRHWIWAATITLSAFLAGALVFNDAETFLRPVAVLWFLLVCPGMAFVGLLRLTDWITELWMGVAVSVALNTAVAMAMIYFRLWNTKGGVAALVIITLLGVFLQFVQAAYSRWAMLRRRRLVPVHGGGEQV
jgi:hypothetical membrane protein